MQTYKNYKQCTTILTDNNKIFISQMYLFSYVLRSFHSSWVKNKTTHKFTKLVFNRLKMSLRSSSSNLDKITLIIHIKNRNLKYFLIQIKD